VSRRNLRSFVRSLELDGTGPVRVRTTDESRPNFDVVVFIEPMHADNRDVIGFDLSADPAQREAMERAQDLGEPVLAGRPTSDAGVTAGEGAILYVPVYRSGAPTGSIEERRRAIYGFVFSPVRPSDLLEEAAASWLQPVVVEVYDGIEATASELLHATQEAPAIPEFESSAPLTIAGHRWLLVVKSIDEKPVLLPRSARTTLALGLLLTSILFVIVRLQFRAWETAKRHETEIRASERALRASEARLRDALASEQEARAQAQAADRAKDDFLVAVSHELRTPISAMLGWLTMLKSGAVREDQRQLALEVVERNANLQARLIEDLLDVSRILLGRMSVDLQPLAVGPSVRLVIESLRPTAMKAGVDLRVPSMSGRGIIRGDSARVQQIVWNLVSNAVKFTPSGGAVTVDVSDDGEMVEVSVKDTGIGIEPEFLPHIFDRFSQAGGSGARAQTGLGLGMAITRQLVELHHGTIEAFSAGRNCGTTFVVRFPAAPASVTADEEPELDDFQGLPDDVGSVPLPPGGDPGAHRVPFARQ
jgi:signal transduction histidine kinase